MEMRRFMTMGYNYHISDYGSEVDEDRIEQCRITELPN